jgi:hypothetical protein
MRIQILKLMFEFWKRVYFNLEKICWNIIKMFFLPFFFVESTSVKSWKWNKNQSWLLLNIVLYHTVFWASERGFRYADSRFSVTSYALHFIIKKWDFIIKKWDRSSIFILSIILLHLCYILFVLLPFKKVIEKSVPQHLSNTYQGNLPTE